MGAMELAKAGLRRVPGAVPAVSKGRLVAREQRRRLEQARGWVQQGVPPFEQLSPQAVVSLAYEVLVHRPPDPPALERFTAQLASGEIGPYDVVDQVRTSDEFRFRAPIGVRALLGTLHLSRCEFILGLPRARRIIDLGGSHTANPWGAMVLLGYPYEFEELVIVDLPPEERHDLYRSEAYQDVRTPLGPVNYRFQSMTDLSFAPDGSIDLVYSGQSFEHVTPDDAKLVLEEVRRVLRPGGWFALDTPNAAVCRLQQDELIDPDHKIEYRLDELRDVLQGAGFEVVEEKGLAYAGAGVAEGRFDPAELARHPGVFHEAEDCYLLALLCRRPA